MHFGFSNKKKEELVLSLHVGSSAVGGALVRLDRLGVPKIIFSVIEAIPLEEKLDTGRFFLKTLQSLQVVVQKIHKSALGAPERIFCVLGSPWYASQMRVIALKKNTPFTFTEKIADELLQKEIKLMGEEHLLTYGQNAIRAIELKNIRTTLNGYETEEPLYKEAREIEMSIFISLSGEATLHKIENTIRKSFQFDQVKFSSFAMVSFTVVRDLHPDQDSFLLVDVGGEVTEIFIVKKNILQDSISFPAGCNFFTRSIAQELQSTLSEARSLISLYKDGHAEGGVAAKIGSVLGKLRAAWLTKFQESLANISADISIPSQVYITADSSFIDLLAATIKAEQFGQYSSTDSKFEITAVDAKLLHNLALFEEQVARDPVLIMDSVYINRFLTKTW